MGEAYRPLTVPSREFRTILVRRLERLVDLLHQVEHLHARLLGDAEATFLTPAATPEGRAGELLRAGLEEYHAALDWLLANEPRELQEFQECLGFLKEADRKLNCAERLAS